MAVGEDSRGGCCAFSFAGGAKAGKGIGGFKDSLHVIPRSEPEPALPGPALSRGIPPVLSHTSPVAPWVTMAFFFQVPPSGCALFLMNSFSALNAMCVFQKAEAQPGIEHPSP